MEKYKLCPGCGTHNDPLAIECATCGEDLSSVRILDVQTESQFNTADPVASQPTTKSARMVRICEECGTKNEPQARKCANCGEDISTVLPTPDEVSEVRFTLASEDGEYSFSVPLTGEAIVIGRENRMREYLQDKLYVSRKHAELSVSGGKLQIKSFAEATNGTHVNGVAVPPETKVSLTVGDTIGLGGNDPATQKEAAYFRVICS